MKNNKICGKLRKMANFAAAKNHDVSQVLKSHLGLKFTQYFLQQRKCVYECKILF